MYGNGGHVTTGIWGTSSKQLPEVLLGMNSREPLWTCLPFRSAPWPPLTLTEGSAASGAQSSSSHGLHRGLLLLGQYFPECDSLSCPLFLRLPLRCLIQDCPLRVHFMDNSASRPLNFCAPSFLGNVSESLSSELTVQMYEETRSLII